MNVEFIRLDLGSIQSTKDFVKTFKDKNLPLHILINNAGIAMVPFSKWPFLIKCSLNQSVCTFYCAGMTDEGHEMHYQVQLLKSYLMCVENKYLDYIYYK